MDIKNKNLAGQGKLKIQWAAQSMPVLRSIKCRFLEEKPLTGIRIAACLHVTTETEYLAETLKARGADVFLCASDPLSTQDEVTASLAVNEGLEVFAIKGENKDTYYSHIHSVLDSKPHITMDDGADLLNTLHSERREMLENILAGTEETTTGVIRLKAMADKLVLQYPVVAVNDADTKHLFDNRYGTGQSTIDGIIRSTDRLLAGSCFVVSGYGWCGRGLAMRAAGMGARIVITETDPIKALEAVMDGSQVMPIREAAKIGDIFCTVTGDIHVIGREHFELMKDGAILSNSGHFNVELDLESLDETAESKRSIRDNLEEFTLPDGRRIYVLGEGRLINLAAAEGHPSSVMDMSFANQALCAEYIVKNSSSLKPVVYSVPEEIDRQIAALKLTCMEVSIDSLTAEQKKYLNSYEIGT